MLTTKVGDFARRDLAFRGKTKPVLTTGAAGAAVIITHEAAGFTPALARFCRWVRDGGFRVYAPVLVGSVDADNPELPGPGRLLRLCISREFHVFAAGGSSPVIDWLKELARFAHRECGVVVGMCLTGNFGLAMAADPVVLAPILGQPSLPVYKPAALGLSGSELAAVRHRVETEGLVIRGYRFHGDRMCRAARFETLRRELGTGFIGKTLPDSAGHPEKRKPPHGVFTTELIDEAGQPTRAAVDEVIGFLQQRLCSPA